MKTVVKISFWGCSLFILPFILILIKSFILFSFYTVMPLDLFVEGELKIISYDAEENTVTRMWHREASNRYTGTITHQLIKVNFEQESQVILNLDEEVIFERGTDSFISISEVSSLDPGLYKWETTITVDLDYSLVDKSAKYIDFFEVK